MSFSLLIGGDIVPSSINCSLNNNQRPTLLKPELFELLYAADYTIFNLECPISDIGEKISKEGRCFIADTDCISFFKAIRCTALGVANNHIMDYGVEAMQKTLNLLRDNGITPFGYGDDYSASTSMIKLSDNEKTIAIIACCETEFSTFGSGKIGAVPYHDYWTNKSILKAKQECDFVIVLYHGGKEYYPYVAPYHQDRCHIMVDAGADLILSQHSHCVGCSETYKGSTIVYGQGNFAFNQSNSKPETKEGLLAKITVSDSLSLELIPVTLQDSSLGLAEEDMSSAIMSAFEERSYAIASRDNVLQLYSDYARSNMSQYLTRCSSDAGIIDLLSRISTKLNIPLYSREKLLTIQNTLQNEAHRNLFLEGIRNYLSSKNK